MLNEGEFRALRTAAFACVRPKQMAVPFVDWSRGRW